MKAIDMRCRPAIKGLQNQWIYDTENMVHFAKYFGGSYLAESAKEKSIEKLLEEMESLEIEKEINAEAAELIEKYPDKFVGFVGVDVSEMEQGILDIDKYVINGNFVGVNIEPGNPPAGKEPMFIDDERIFPLYEKCQANNIPLTITFGGPSFPDATAMLPHRVENVVRAFPDLKICFCHGAWPMFRELETVMMSYPNIYVCVDSYLMLLPGYQDYILAANYAFQDNIMFGSSYPLHAQEKVKNFYLQAGFREEVLPKVLYDNAARFLGIAYGNPQPTMHELHKM